ncbi:MAG: NRDE family protein [Limisphaerales bacterium]
MCTVTLVARERGFHLGMNRDEQRSRPIGLPPERGRSGDRIIVYPSEPGGGTWIAVNDAGIALALINWYAVARRVPSDGLSRGEVIPAMIPESDLDAAGARLRLLSRERINPFRLIGVDRRARRVVEWRWDLSALDQVEHPWVTQLWASSGSDERAAQASRQRVFEEFLAQPTAGTLDWLRRLHRSHRPIPGADSICMHRSDAATVSYTEVEADDGGEVVMRYRIGAPCEFPETGIRSRRTSSQRALRAWAGR